MTKTPHRYFCGLVGALALCALQGCGNPSRGVTANGTVATPVFPDKVRDATLKEGTYPNLDNLRAIAPGMTKDQLYDLLGIPHFPAGTVGVREWDYLFHFRRPDKSVVSCQYKAVFDQSYRAQSFHWLPAQCADLLKPPPVAANPPPVIQAMPAPPAPPVVPRKTVLAADGLFRFNGASDADLMSEGRRKIVALAQDIRRAAAATPAINVTGHTDRIGTTAYNDALSLARADTVRAVLIQQGMTPSAIRTRGMGSRQPVVDCLEVREMPALVNCLQPNRRVDIEVAIDRL